MRPETLTELCEKYDIERPPDTRGKSFPDFDPFARCYIAVCECLRKEEDLRRLVREVAEDSAESGATWIEPALSLELYADRLGGFEATLRMLFSAAEEAEELTGVAMGFIVAAERHMPIARADKLAATVKKLVEGSAKIKGRQGIVGFGLHGPEAGHPPQPWKEAFKTACVEGVVPLPHAGEYPPSEEPGAGAESVRFCVDTLGAPRIAHGVLAAGDNGLIAHLADLKVCLDICPTSNQLLGTVPGQGLQSPLKQFLEAGVPCTINSDDPLLFGCCLLGEYERCRQELSMSDEELASCAAASFEHSRAPDALKQKGLDGVKAWLQSNGQERASGKRTHGDAFEPLKTRD
ncbi:unnamed protein product [Symbiodinium natans]|uniref:Adenosine deaminase domain-containing protein n=1 Tax=Symbiodinium natans TaxID=878477 RepID=A0A812GK34_9DINO|nr:unnamed protein product [Symbiodinium natans]